MSTLSNFARVRDDWFDLAARKRAPVRATELDEACWRVVQRLAALDAHVATAGAKGGLYFECVGTVNPTDLAAAESALGATLPDELVALALRVGVLVELGDRGRFECKRPPPARNFAAQGGPVRAVFVGTDARDTFGDGAKAAGHNEAWLAIEGPRRGELAMQWAPFGRKGAPEGEPWRPGPTQGLLAWVDDLLATAMTRAGVALK